MNTFKIERVDFYSFDEVKNNVIFQEKIGSKPKFVEFDSEPFLYEEALILAKEEIDDMFKNCTSYEDAKLVILNDENVCSTEHGYSGSENSTGHLYTCWAVVWGNNIDKSVYWDVRWY